jgi:hypothetical protein
MKIENWRTRTVTPTIMQIKEDLAIDLVNLERSKVSLEERMLVLKWVLINLAF